MTYFICIDSMQGVMLKALVDSLKKMIVISLQRNVARFYLQLKAGIIDAINGFIDKLH
ncbi:MAG: hypothetical protein II453_20065 [Alphaproteobacteria bacterium]|nr:hypothetical protein [Alphaproteobacteria bacterium]